ncbi:MAG: hypothetical protein ACJ779_11805 [Chloroflexota bacterium]
MLLRIVHATDPRPADASAGEAVARATLTPDLDRDRLSRTAARIKGLETLILGWPPNESGVPAGCPSVIVLSWVDVSSMLTAAGANDDAFLRDRLGLDVVVTGAESFELTSRTFGALPATSSLLRILSLRVRSPGDAELFDRLRNVQERLTGLGLVASQVARRVTPEGIEAVVVGLWRDQAAIDEATRGELDRPAFADEIEPWIESATVTPYRAIEIAPHLPMGSGPPILVLDDDGRVVDLTPAAAASLGRTQGEAVGLTIFEVTGGVDGWLSLLASDDPDDEAGRSASPLVSGTVRIHWRLRRHVPVEHRHLLLVRREHEPAITSDDIDAAVADAFPPS